MTVTADGIESPLKGSDPVPYAGTEDRRLLVTVGIPLGFAQATQDTDSRPGLIRRGQQFVQVAPEALAVLARAVSPITALDLASRAGGGTIPGVDDLIAELVDAGLLLPLAEDDVARRAQLSDLRLQTTGLGLGSLSESSAAFVIGDHNLNELLTCDSALYSTWSASDGRSLQKVVDQVVANQNVEVREVLINHIFTHVVDLLNSGVAFLDINP